MVASSCRQAPTSTWSCSSAPVNRGEATKADVPFLASSPRPLVLRASSRGAFFLRGDGRATANAVQGRAQMLMVLVFIESIQFGFGGISG